MSRLFRDHQRKAKARPGTSPLQSANMPPPPEFPSSPARHVESEYSLHANAEEEELEDEDDEEEDAFAPLPPLPHPAAQPKRSARKEYSPLQWQDYFDVSRDVTIPETRDTFRVYEIHGADPAAPVFVMHHGAGHSALSFGLCAKTIKRISGGRCSVLAYDCRGHGDTRTESEENMSLSTLSQDAADVVHAAFADKLPDSIILVGHSMGGAVVGDVAHQRLIPKASGVAIIDVVEGTAIESLEYMLSVLDNRPRGFKSLEKAIEWALQSHTIRNLESARLSIPAQLVATTPDDAEHALGFAYRWRTNLRKTQPFWNEWFVGLSEKFLTSRVAKLLILAGTDRLDKALTIGQMQGKFQLILLPEAGHTIQEDDPERVGAHIHDFMKRNERLVLPKKVGQL